MTIHRAASIYRTAVTGTVALLATAGLVGFASASPSAGAKDGASAATVAVASVDTSAKSALRVGKNGVCESGELCLYFLQQRRTPVFDLFVDDANFFGDRFPGTSTSADNNTRSYINRDSFYWRVYSGANYSGTEILCIAPGDRGNFSRRDWDTASSARFSSTAC